ncbi:MAG: hypothetical protein KBA61_00905 [Spirochaetes bacterium]|nr:hypothetical protein [Spirochaetota bacterium]
MKTALAPKKAPWPEPLKLKRDSFFLKEMNIVMQIAVTDKMEKIYLLITASLLENKKNLAIWL